MIVGVLYTGYRGTLVMNQPHNPSRDMSGLPTAAHRGFWYPVGTIGVGSSRSGSIECLT
jgi:hypothetical protein